MTERQCVNQTKPSRMLELVILLYNYRFLPCHRTFHVSAMGGSQPLHRKSDRRPEKNLPSYDYTSPQDYIKL